ncbi:unnamed protein product, partial [Nesidiocoris tenuis]
PVIRPNLSSRSRHRGGNLSGNETISHSAGRLWNGGDVRPGGSAAPIGRERAPPPPEGPPNSCASEGEQSRPRTGKKRIERRRPVSTVAQ